MEIYSSSPNSDDFPYYSSSYGSNYSSKKKKKRNKNKDRLAQHIREESNIFEAFNNNYIEDDEYEFKYTTEIKPRNKLQEEYTNHLYNDNISIIFSVGPAGTGKTYISCNYAIKQYLEENIRKIIITRPTVSVDEDHGFLPGSMNDKMKPWLQPIYDNFSKSISTSYLQKLIKCENIEICPLAYMRGRTFDDCIIIADEMQNSTENQMKMLLTRIGENTKLIINGDLNQSDNNRNGLKDFIFRYKNCNLCEKDKIKIIEFKNGDIQRNPIIKTVLKIYGE